MKKVMSCETSLFQVFSLFALRAAEHANSVLVKLVLSLLQLCKLAANHPGGADILGMK